MISPAKQQAIVVIPSIFDFLLFTVAVAMEDLLHMLLYHTLQTNQMVYIKVKVQLPGIYGNVNQPLSSGYALGFGRFIAINPRQLDFNYYVMISKGWSYTSTVSVLTPV